MSQKVALVTGGSRGIGAACALALGRAGYKVAVHYRSGEEGARAVVSELPSGHAVAFKADLSDPAACQNLVKSVKEQLGSVDVLVNNAGVAIDQVLAFAKPDDFDTLIATNLRPVFLLSKHAAKVMNHRFYSKHRPRARGSWHPLQLRGTRLYCHRYDQGSQRRGQTVDPGARPAQTFGHSRGHRQCGRIPSVRSGQLHYWHYDSCKWWDVHHLAPRIRTA